jgi:hypothetical protein
MKKWDAYVISLDRTPERMRFMEAEFKDTVLNLQKFSAHDDPLKRGWVGVGKSYGNIVKKHMETGAPEALLLEVKNERAGLEDIAR